jgi:hypothetical protein
MPRTVARRVLQVLVIAGALVVPATAFAQRPPLEMPRDGATVVERLPRGYAALAPARRQPPLQQAAALLASAASTGDARLAARAEALLARYPDKTDEPAILRLRAFAAQHRHRFGEAAALLARVVRLSPRDGSARSSLVQVHLVQGRLDLARRECAALALGIDAQEAWVCLASLALRRGDHARAARAADRWLAQPSPDPAALRYMEVMRGEIASRAGDPGADAWFERALALGPDDVRTLSAFARHLRATQRPQAVVALLGDAPATETLALQQALAAREAGDPRAPMFARKLADRFARAHALGVEPELRDEAEFKLVFEGDAKGALALARRNFATQRDVEDVALVVRATQATRR